MPFDKLDKKVQEAAEQHSPAYSEDAWLKMEALLNEQMPQNETVKRKLPLGWIFALLLIAAGGGVVVLSVHSWNHKKKESGVANIKNIIPAVHNDSSNNSNLKSTVATQTIKKPGQKEVIPATNSQQQILPLVTAFNKKLNKNLPVASLASQDVYKANEMQLVNKKKASILKAHYDRLLMANDFEHQIISNIIIDNEKIFAKNISVNKSIIQKHISNIAVTTKPTDKIKNKFDDLFSLNFSVGPDVSAVDVNNIGTVKLLYGAGIGYSFAKRWQLRAGFYTVKKVYEAAPSDYHPPANFWNYYPGLEDVNANCKVIEVPLIVNYKISEAAKHAWFVSAGLSSYFMKKETYNYHSKIAPGQYQDKIYTIKNQNEHYLSSLRLSAGYEKKLNKTISLSAEPYLNIPLSGVGYGKVKLNGAGLIFSISVKPFVKK